MAQAVREGAALQARGFRVAMDDVLQRRRGEPSSLHREKERRVGFVAQHPGSRAGQVLSEVVRGDFPQRDDAILLALAFEHGHVAAIQIEVRDRQVAQLRVAQAGRVERL